MRCAEVWTGVGAEGPEEGPGHGKVRGELTECSAHGWVPRERGWEESKMALRFWALRAPAEEASSKAAGFMGAGDAVGRCRRFHIHMASGQWSSGS